MEARGKFSAPAYPARLYYPKAGPPRSSAIGTESPLALRMHVDVSAMLILLSSGC